MQGHSCIPKIINDIQNRNLTNDRNETYDKNETHDINIANDRNDLNDGNETNDANIFTCWTKRYLLLPQRVSLKQTSDAAL